MLDTQTANPQAQKWAKVIDHTRCIGCHACTTACKSENEVPVGVTRTYVKYVDVGTFPQARRSFQVTRCNQCAESPCTNACPTSAMHRRPDGIVDFDKSICIGCKACIAACPYDAIFINPEDHSAEKCNFCAHRLDVGLEPACVVVCPTQAILVGDMNDPLSRVAEIINRDAVAVRRPEKETHPKLFYKGADQVTLDPLAAARPGGGLFMWSEAGNVPHGVESGHPGDWNNSASAVLSYDVPHRAPWDWRVSAYTWTKSIAAGAYLAPLALILGGWLAWDSVVWTWMAPIVAGIFLGLTGLLLIWDLEHPTRFYMIFTRPHWKSWLVKGAFIIAGYSAVLAIHFGAVAAGRPDIARWLAIAGAPLAIMTAAYTAYLFAQSTARDLWQNPLLPAQLVFQAFMAGAGVMLLAAAPGMPEVVGPMAWLFAAATAGHVLLAAGEATASHPTAHAKLAAHEMIGGRYKAFFWGGLVLCAGAVAAPWVSPWLALAGLVGLLLHEHAYVQAAQSVPLA